MNVTNNREKFDIFIYTLRLEIQHIQPSIRCAIRVDMTDVYTTRNNIMNPIKHIHE